MGHGEAFRIEDFRRMLVNSCFWCLRMESQIDPSAKVEIIGTYNPGEVGGKGLKKGIKPGSSL